MKNLLKCGFIAVVICFTSCGNEQAILNDPKHPFIVTGVSSYSETHSSYYNDGIGDLSGTVNNLCGSWYARVVLPTGMYNVGDTIVVRRYYR